MTMPTARSEHQFCRCVHDAVVLLTYRKQLGEEPGIKLSEVKKVLDTPEQSFEDMETAGMDIPGVDQDIPGVDQVTNTAENDRVAMIKHAEHAESPKSGPRTPRELLRKRADLRREISGKRHLEEGEAGSTHFPRSCPLLGCGICSRF